MHVSDTFFRSHPEPMWVVEIDTWRILDVNEAAIRHYGYSRKAFLKLTLADLSAEDRRPQQFDSHRDAQKVCRHTTREGRIIHVRMTFAPVEFNGRPAQLVAGSDVTDLIAVQQSLAEDAARERALRAESEASAARFQVLFEAVPSKLLVLSPGDYEILAVSEAFLQSAHYKREALVGHSLFDVLAEPASVPGGAAD